MMGPFVKLYRSLDSGTSSTDKMLWSSGNTRHWNYFAAWIQAYTGLLSFKVFLTYSDLFLIISKIMCCVASWSQKDNVAFISACSVIQLAFCPRILLKLSLYSDLYFHLEFSSSTNRSTIWLSAAFKQKLNVILLFNYLLLTGHV